MTRPSFFLASLALLSTCAPSAAPAPQNARAELLEPGRLSTEANEYNPSLSPDGRTLVFARSGPDFRDAKVFVSTLRNGRWSEPRPAPFTDARWDDSDPTFAPDGRALYFISTRPGPGRDTTRADLDVWRVRVDGERWGEPEHLGDGVNSRGQELGPSYRDGVLYFSSARRSGRGGLDLYTAREADGRFAAATLLEGPLNTAASESDVEVSADGALLLFWSDRPGGRGEGDLYASRRTAAGWGDPVPLRGEASSPGFDFTPTVSPDGRWLYFASTRADSAAANPVLNGQSNLYRIPAAPVLP